MQNRELFITANPVDSLESFQYKLPIQRFVKSDFLEYFSLKIKIIAALNMWMEKIWKIWDLLNFFLTRFNEFYMLQASLACFFFFEWMLSGFSGLPNFCWRGKKGRLHTICVTDTLSSLENENQSLVCEISLYYATHSSLQIANNANANNFLWLT